MASTSTVDNIFSTIYDSLYAQPITFPMFLAQSEDAPTKLELDHPNASTMQTIGIESLESNNIFQRILLGLVFLSRLLIWFWIEAKTWKTLVASRVLHGHRTRWSQNQCAKDEPCFNSRLPCKTSLQPHWIERKNIGNMTRYKQHLDTLTVTCLGEVTHHIPK